MSLLPPHLIEDEEQLLSENNTGLNWNKIGPQGPSKYGKGGARLYKARGRAGRK